jgi:ABC-type transport system involved in cytochrome bd biosynthesis fused ATPase/permease subunit
MQGNIGQFDQVIRGAVGAALILLASTGTTGGALQVLMIAIGSMAVFTATARFCPIYRVLSRPRSRS